MTNQADGERSRHMRFIVLTARAQQVIASRIAGAFVNSHMEMQTERKGNAYRISVTQTFNAAQIDAITDDLRALGPNHVVILEEEQDE